MKDDKLFGLRDVGRMLVSAFKTESGQLRLWRLLFALSALGLASAEAGGAVDLGALFSEVMRALTGAAP